MAPERLCGPGALDDLLAAAVLGHASKATAGLKFGLLQPLAPYPPKRLPRKYPLLGVDAAAFLRIAAAGAASDAAARAEAAVQAGVRVEAARAMAPKALIARLGRVKLEAVVHPRALETLGFGAPPEPEDEEPWWFQATEEPDEGSDEDDDAAVSDGIEEMSEADETDSESDEYVSLEDSEDIFLRSSSASARAVFDRRSGGRALWLRPGQKPNSQF